jgi:hypothetical protein
MNAEYRKYDTSCGVVRSRVLFLGVKIRRD